MVFKRIAAGIGLGVVLLAGQPAEAATFAGQNGRVAYVTASGGVWTVDGKGGQAQRLLSRNAQDITWSPDGASLAFVEPRKNGNKRVAVMNVGTGAVRYVTQRPHASEGTPVWSYGGSRLAFVRTLHTKTGDRSAVFAVNIKDGNEQNISGWSTQLSYRAPSWEPGDRRMVYEELSAASSRLLIQELATGATRELVGLSDVTSSSKASWSPNGKKILFTDSDGQVYTIWADGTHRSVISDGDSYEASWSPDGSRIAFLEDFSGESISVSGPDGSVSYVPLSLAGYDNVSAPVWSPDGTKLSFTAARTGTNARDLFVTTIQETTPSVVRQAFNVQADVTWQVWH